MRIGNIELKHGLMLAPLAGVSDHAFRTLCRSYGAEYVVSEMVSAKAVHFKDRKSDALAVVTDPERPMAIQIFGHEPEIMAASAKKLCDKFHPDAMDINMGCPVHKIVGGGDGSALMKNPKLAGEIVAAVKGALDIPVTVKIRAGWDSNSINAVEVASICEENGASMVCVHGRTREQLYRPPSDNTVIRDVKRALTIPVVGNGGIENAADAVRMFEETGCDGIMIARGCCGNPWIFSEITAALEGKSYEYPSLDTRLEIAAYHARSIVADKGEKMGVLESRKLISWYISGIPGAPEARARVNSSTSLEEIEQILLDLRANNK
ncbi:MAG: tRNA dihydrouridine synthase DusB [Clostridia bacterium]|nr:tRNA dihydrouridine synthase DusB [Clostridia bacterium]